MRGRSGMGGCVGTWAGVMDSWDVLLCCCFVLLHAHLHLPPAPAGNWEYIHCRGSVGRECCCRVLLLGAAAGCCRMPVLMHPFPCQHTRCLLQTPRPFPLHLSKTTASLLLLLHPPRPSRPPPLPNTTAYGEGSQGSFDGLVTNVHITDQELEGLPPRESWHLSEHITMSIANVKSTSSWRLDEVIKRLEVIDACCCPCRRAVRAAAPPRAGPGWKQLQRWGGVLWQSALTCMYGYTNGLLSWAMKQDMACVYVRLYGMHVMRGTHCGNVYRCMRLWYPRSSLYTANSQPISNPFLPRQPPSTRPLPQLDTHLLLRPAGAGPVLQQGEAGTPRGGAS